MQVEFSLDCMILLPIFCIINIPKLHNLILFDIERSCKIFKIGATTRLNQYVNALINFLV